MNKERLLKLADHLEFGKLNADVFNFKVLYQEDYPILGTGTCGTNACALGECPTIFNEWTFLVDKSISRFDNNIVMTYPTLKGIDSSNYVNPSFQSAIEFFDITPIEADILFMPSEDTKEYEDENDEEGQNLYKVINNEEFYGIPGNSTKQDVAQHIRKFVELKENERISRSS